MAKAKKWFQRKGAVAVTLAFLLIPMLLFVALCVDIGWITKAKSELQNASDAAAAAGAAKLMDNYSASVLPIQPNYNSIVTSAKSSASSYVMQYGRYNGAGNVNSLQILQGDIQYGFTDASGAYNPNYTGYPNTVRVMGRLDPTANGSLPLFFGGITGRDKSALTAFSNATIYTGVINSFDPNSGSWGDTSNGSCHCNHPCLLLPVAFDINSWKQFFASGVSPDGVVHTDSTGAAQIQIYPSPQMAPGNFGLLCIGPWTNSDAIYADWVEYGPSASDIQTLIDEGKLPTSESNPKSWKGSPGLRNTLRKQFIDIIGMPRLLPLFIPASQNPYQAASGVGSNASYKIAAFAGVKVTSVTGNGTNLNITVQPYDVLDPTALYDSSTICPVGTEPPAQMKSFTHTAPKLTQ